MTEIILLALGIVVGALLVIIVRRVMTPTKPQDDTDDQARRESWVITPEDIRNATPPAASTRPLPHGPRYRIRYRSDLGSWAIYRWQTGYERLPGNLISYPSGGHWELHTRVPTWRDAINLITPSPATEWGSSH